MDWIKALFSEDCKPSFGRVGSFMAFLISSAWVSWIVYKTNALPDLGGISLFIGTLYGLSKGFSALTANKGVQNGPT